MFRVCQVPGKGIGLRATECIAVGSVVLIEKAVSFGFFPSLAAQICETCGETSISGMPIQCNKCCLITAFCSPACQRIHQHSNVIKSVKCFSDEDAALMISLARLLVAPEVVREEFRTLTPGKCQIDPHVDQMYSTLKGEANNDDDDDDVHLSLMSQEEFRLDARVEENNSFGLFDVVGSDGPLFCYGRALLLQGARLNHSCRPNLTRIRLHSSSMIFVANRTIQTDEELSITYLPLGMERNERRKTLFEDYGFECKCERCESDSIEPPTPLCEIPFCRGECLYLINDWLCVHHDRREIVEMILANQ